ncbi:MAG: LamG-like jellyroll fold domain-containing protein [Planctomycetota bacterium]
MKALERDELIDSLIEGDITEADFLRLEAEMSVDAEVRQAYYRRLKLTHLLRLEAGDVSGQSSEPTLTPAAEQRRDRSEVPWQVIWPWLLSVAASVAFFALWMSRPFDSPRVAESMGSVVRSADEEPSAQGFAIVSAQANATWDGASLENGSLVPTGEIRLRSGLAHLEFFSGVQMVIEGDAVFSIDSPMQITMTRGSGRAQVPEPAKGFRVKTSSGDIVDLGTEFVVNANADDAKVLVVDGEVEIQPTAASPRRLLTGEQANLDRDVPDQGTVTALMVGPSEFQDHVAEQTSHQIERWRASHSDMQSDPRLLGHYVMESEVTWSRTVGNRAMQNPNVASEGAAVAARRVTNRWGHRDAALDFSRLGSRMRVQVPGEHVGLTLLCWVKINSLDRWYNALFLTDGHEDGEPHWQIMNDGRLFFSVKKPAGQHDEKPRQHIYYSPPFWNTSLSGRWLMIAATYDVENRRVRHFVNGKIVSEADITEDALVDAIRIGDASICNWSEPMYRTDPTFVVRNLNGCMDEFALYDAALSSKEILNLYRAGSPDE